jgi:hypothetical protein
MAKTWKLAGLNRKDFLKAGMLVTTSAFLGGNSLARTVA